MHTHAEAQQPLRHITHDVTLHVSDSQRSLAFYRDLLGFSLIEQQAIEGQPGAVVLLMDTGNGNRLRLENFPTQPQPSLWLPDDLQPGYRHLGFKVQNTDASTARLKAADVPFTLNPLDATGGVRISFFKDPDGILLELLEGSLAYHQVGSAVAPALPDLPQAQGQGELVYDHVAITSETEEAGDGTNLSRRLCMGYCNCFLSN
jgi:catechol 2,3-dioxygenase-like lactoylglutathione lyase family enzyme